MPIFEGLRISNIVWGFVGFLTGYFTGVTVTITINVTGKPRRSWGVIITAAVIAGLIVALLKINDSLDAFFTGCALGVAFSITMQQHEPTNGRASFPTSSQKLKKIEAKQRRNKPKNTDDQPPKLFS